MSQGDVLRYLRRHGEGTSKDIADATGLRISSIQANLKRLRKKSYVVMRKEPIPGMGACCTRVVYELKAVV